MHELAIFKLCVLREDGDRNSVEVLEILRSMVRSLNHAGIAFEILALPRAKLAVYQGEFEANGVTSLPALVDTQTGKCVAQGVPGITRWMQNSLKDQTTPDENYHDWVADKVGTADEVAREQASGRRGEDEDKFSGGAQRGPDVQGVRRLCSRARARGVARSAQGRTRARGKPRPPKRVR